MKCLYCGRRIWSWQTTGYGPVSLSWLGNPAAVKREAPERYHHKCFKKAFPGISETRHG